MAEKHFLYSYEIIRKTNFILHLRTFLIVVCCICVFLAIGSCRNRNSDKSEKLYKIEPQEYYIIGKTTKYDADNNGQLYYIASKEKIGENEKKWVYDYEFLPLDLLTKQNFNPGDRVTIKYTNEKFEHHKNVVAKNSYEAVIYIFLIISLFTILLLAPFN